MGGRRGAAQPWGATRGLGGVGRKCWGSAFAKEDKQAGRQKC